MYLIEKGCNIGHRAFYFKSTKIHLLKGAFGIFFQATMPETQHLCICLKLKTSTFNTRMNIEGEPKNILYEIYKCKIRYFDSSSGPFIYDVTENVIRVL